jgi:hypothetical protein
LVRVQPPPPNLLMFSDSCSLAKGLEERLQNKL